MAKERLDILLVNQGLVESREQAQRMIRAGHVMVDGQTMTKPGQALSEAVVCTLRELPRF
ncbi:MAG: S4 domain-containing protein, partial [Verrucomicrobia bacterium]|nr:S4 domain-containing protein [Verrucomicrobiota bacterium]